MGKIKDDDEENAYESLDDWKAEDANALKDSIQQHAELIQGVDDMLQDDEDLRPVHVKFGGSSSQHLTESWHDEPNGVFTPSLSSRSSGLQSALKSSKKGIHDAPGSRVKFSPDVRGTFTTNAQLRSGTKIRGLMCLLCLVGSLCLALFVGQGRTGRFITNLMIGTVPGTTAVKSSPIVIVGIPPALGNYPAYNATFELPALEEMNIILSPEMENLADWRIPYPAANRTDLPLFWQIPNSGAQAVQRILGQCLGLVEVSSTGAGRSETALQLLETSEGIRYVNVDPTTVEGLKRAKDLGLATLGLAEVMFTNLIPESAHLFNPTNRGRLFAVFRHPLERAMNVYHNAKVANPDVAEMPMAEYVADYLANNEMVRTLAVKDPNEILTDADLYVAMEVLRRKCVVGLVDRMEESMTRFRGYFGWSSLLLDGEAKCQSELLAPTMSQYPMPAAGTEAYNLMVGQNRLDLRLFEYAQYLYDVQGGVARTDI